MRDQLLKEKKIKRIVIKIGSALLTKNNFTDLSDSHQMIDTIAKTVVYFKKMGIKTLLVTSGAVAIGNMVLKQYGRNEIKDKHARQVLASLGQSILMNLYRKSFAKVGLPISQLLLTARDFRDRNAYLNMGHTIQLIDNIDAQAIINENDTIGSKELEFGDNDTMAAACTAIFKAQLLIILTDVNGFVHEGKRLPLINKLTPDIVKSAKGPRGAGSGGMLTKIRAAYLCHLIGSDTVILPGDSDATIVQDFFENKDIGTMIALRLNPERTLRERKKWLLFSPTRGAVILDQGAKNALLYKGSSILLPGILTTIGVFHSKEIIEILDEEQKILGKGIVDYTSREIHEMISKTREKSETNQVFKTVVLHRNNLVIMEITEKSE